MSPGRPLHLRWRAVGLVVLGGAFGACARYLLSLLIADWHGMPLGTFVINVTGSFLLGLVTGWAAAHALPAEWRLIIGTGFLGGYTTFSTASLETVRLAQEGRWRASALNAFGMLLGALLAAAFGLWLGGLAA